MTTVRTGDGRTYRPDGGELHIDAAEQGPSAYQYRSGKVRSVLLLQLEFFGV